MSKNLFLSLCLLATVSTQHIFTNDIVKSMLSGTNDAYAQATKRLAALPVNNCHTLTKALKRCSEKTTLEDARTCCEIVQTRAKHNVEDNVKALLTILVSETIAVIALPSSKHSAVGVIAAVTVIPLAIDTLGTAVVHNLADQPSAIK